MTKTIFQRTPRLMQIGAVIIALCCVAFGFAKVQAAGSARPRSAAPLGQTIWFNANSNNMYVSADQNLTDVNLVANRTQAQGWEMFTIVDAGGGLIGLRASNGKYVSADQNKSSYLVANRTALQGWEKFQWIDAGTGKVQLKASVNNMFVSADTNIGGQLVANRSVAQGWETFNWGTSTTPPPPPPGGNFPARFAAPYVESWTNMSVNNLATTTGHKFYTLAFIIAPGGGGCTATWNGDTYLSSNLYLNDINNLRNQGGDVIISFGGAAGTELGRACGDVASLQAAYQSVITKYNLKWIDLDIESGAENDPASIDRRNKAIKNLEAANPGLKVSYTLGVARSGLPQGQLSVLLNAKSNGTRVDIVNIMAMDYGPCYSDMGQAAVDAANATNNQLTANGISAKVGVTPMIGVNDVTCEVFSTYDAQVLVNYAQSHSYISLLAYWAMGADGNRNYLNIFKTFH